MRVLFASTRGAGHFNPLVPFIEGCRERGHDVLVVGPPDLDAHGYPFRPGASPPDDVLGPLWERMPSLPPGQGDVVVVGTIFARLNVEAMLPTLRAALEEWSPDLVVRETNEYASAVAADEAGIPHVRVGIGLTLAEEASLTLASPALDERAPGLGARLAASRYVTCFPATVDPASFPARRYRGTGAAAGPSALPDWWPGADGPLVYFTFGSVAGGFANAPRLYRSSIEQLASLPVRVLVTAGHDLDLGELPPNVHVERWIPQAQVLPHAAADVCHGGSGTTLGSLEAGVPLVVVPLFADQFLNAIRVAGAGAGAVASLDTIGAETARVLADGRYGQVAEAVAAEMRTQAPAAAFLDELGEAL